MAITTNGWGAVNVAPIEVVNKSIAKQNKLPGAFTAKSQGKIFMETADCFISGSKTDTNITCKWEKWEMAPNGSGHIVYLSCTLATAFAHFSEEGKEGKEVYDISGSRLDISVDLSAVEDSQYHVPDKKGTANVLMVNSDKDIAVNIQNTTKLNNLPASGDTQLYNSMAIAAFEDYFRDHLKEFKPVFGVILLNAELGEADKNFKWLIPSAVSYACETNRKGSYYGILTMIDNDKIGTHSQQIDTQIFDKIPSGANSALVIGAEKFCKYVLLPSAAAIITGSKIEDFDIGSDRISVTNNKDMKWDNFETGKGKTITPTIPKGAFDMRIMGSFIIIDITGMHYSPSEGITVTTSLTQKIELAIEKRSDGHCVLIPKKDSAFNECTVSSGVQVSEAIKIVNVILEVVSAVAGIACGVGAFGQLFTKAAAVTTEAAAATTEAVAETATISVDMASQTLEAGDIAEVVTQCSESLDEIAAGTTTVTRGGFFASNFCKVATKLSSLVAGLGAIGIATITLIEYIDNKNYDKMPSLNDFGMRLLGNYAWPQMKDAEIIDAELCDVLILYTKIDE